MLKQFHENGRVTWATYVGLRNLLDRYGFSVVWLYHEVGSEECFIRNLIQRVKDCKFQDWCNNINENEKLPTYRQFKSSLEPGKYLSCISVRTYAIALTKLRPQVSDHRLNIEVGRHEGLDVNDKVCQLCNMQCIEDEYHLVMICSCFTGLRNQYLPRYYIMYPNGVKL